MSICDTEPGSVFRAAACALATALGLALAPATAAAGADEDAEGTLALRGEATLGLDLFIIDDPYDDGSLTGYFDQYRHTRGKDDTPPFFLDLMHLDLNLARDDDTSLFRLERWSPNALNDRAEIDVDWEGIGFDLDYGRYRSEELRFFPEGTFQNQPPMPAIPVYGTRYTPDAPLSALLDGDHRFWIRRTGISGEVAVRPKAMGFSLPVLGEASFRSRYESRKGWRQDSFVLDAMRERTATQDIRFRGNRRRIDQEVVTIGGGFVLQPMEALTADFDFSFEAFREGAHTVTDRDLGVVLDVGRGDFGQRGFGFVPDTDRFTGSVALAGQVGPASLSGGGFVTYLEQTNHSPLQRATGRGQRNTTTWSAHAAGDVPLAKQVSLAAHVKFSQRDSNLNHDDFLLDLPPGTPVADATSVQVDPILRRRREVEAEVELTFRPQAGALLGLGYRLDWVERNLRFANGLLVIPDAVNLVEEESEKHVLYLRGRARLLRRIQLAAELGYELAPESDYPRDSRHAIYFDARGTTSLPRPIPLSLSVFGGVRDAKGSGIALNGLDTLNATDSSRKSLDRLEWKYGATVTAQATRQTTISTTFMQMRDEQDMPHVRTLFPRYFSPTFFVAQRSKLEYKSDVKTLNVAAVQRIGKTIDLNGSVNVTWVRAWTENGDDVGSSLNAASEIRSRLLGVSAGIGWQATDALHLGFDYRFDRYVDREDKEPISQDDERHTFMLRATVDFEGLARLGN